MKVLFNQLQSYYAYNTARTSTSTAFTQLEASTNRTTSMYEPLDHFHNFSVNPTHNPINQAPFQTQNPIRGAFHPTHNTIREAFDPTHNPIRQAPFPTAERDSIPFPS